MASFPVTGPGFATSVTGTNSGGTVGATYVQTSSTPATGTGVPWVFNVKDGAYGAKGDGTTDDTAAIQAAINAANTASGGIVFFPAGTYVVSTGLSLDQMYGIALIGASAATQYNTGSSVLLFTGTTGNLISMASSTNCQVGNLRINYNNAGYTGYLINIDGAPHNADCQDNRIFDCSSKYVGTGSYAASAVVRYNKAVINYIDRCHFNHAVNPIRVGDPGGTYVNCLFIDGCTFNFSSNAHILIGTADGETIVISNCTFEGGGIRGASTGQGDAGTNELYSPVIRDCWFGDASGSVNWINGLNVQSSNYVGVINGCRFSTTSGGTHLTLGGRWLVTGNSFENGTFYSAANSGIVSIANYYNNGTITAGTVGVSLGDDNGGTSASYPALGQATSFYGSATLADDALKSLKVGYKPNSGFAGSFTSGPAVYSAYGELVLQAGKNGTTVLAGDNAGTVTALVTVTLNKLGFFGATAVAQPSAVGTATGYTAGATAGTFHEDDTYTGNVGTTGYTINGIVAALKNLGLIAS